MTNQEEATKYKCEWPECKLESCNRFILPVINEEKAQVDLGFCTYHYFLMISKEFSAEIEIIKDENDEDKEIRKFEIIGPFREVQMAEQVMFAREMVLEKEKQKK